MNDTSPQKPYRVGAILLKEGKILVITGKTQHVEEIWWSPGGRIEPNEGPERALERELSEELGVRMTSYKHYCTVSALHISQETAKDFAYYIVGWEGDPEPLEEDGRLAWVGKREVEEGFPLSSTLAETVVPKLIADALIS